MKWNQGLLKGAGLGLVLILTACKDSPNQTKLTYMPDMADAPIVKPMRSYLDPPEGSVAMQAILYPKSEEESAKLLHNPFIGHEKEEQFRAEGAHLYSQACVHCHGLEAKGDGPVSGKFAPPPDITGEVYASKADGHFFHRITFGGPIMPPQGDKLDPDERWKVILHLRALQNANSRGGVEKP